MRVVCKSILTRRGVEFSKKADLPELSKLLAKELQLVPEGISDQARGVETIRLILRNFSALTQYLAELRGLYGSGHGSDGKHKGLEPRHARLAVATAVAFIDFVTETHQHCVASKPTSYSRVTGNPEVMKGHSKKLSEKEPFVTFNLTGEELRKYQRWKVRHDRSCPEKSTTAAGGRITFSFTPTGIGTVVVVKCACGDQINVTDFDSW